MLVKRDYKTIIKSHVKKEYFNVFYEDAVSKYQTKNKFLFCEALQKLIVKIGRVVSNSLISPCSNESNSIGNLDYLCNDILQDRCLYYEFLSTDFNHKGNTAKHHLSMNENTVQIERIAGIYNRMINQLCKKIKDDTLMTYKFIQCKNNKNQKQAVVNKKSKGALKPTSISKENAVLNASFLNDEGVAYRISDLSKRKVILFGVNIKFKSAYTIKRVEVILNTRRGTKLYNAHLGDNHYEIDALEVVNNKIDLKVRVEYVTNSNLVSYKEIHLIKSYK
jgi:hypothetical protein